MSSGEPSDPRGSDGPDQGADPDGQGPARETKGERTRRRLLEIAIERFGERGYRATSVSEVARAAGLTQAAVYAYFPNKEALFDAAVDADATVVIDAARHRAAGTPAGQLVPLLLLLIMTELDAHPLLQRVVAGQEPEALRRLVNLPALSLLTGTIVEAVRAGQADGSVRPDVDAQLFADGAESIMLSLVMSVAQIGASTEARRQMGVISIFDGALRSPPERVAVPAPDDEAVAAP